MKVNIHTGDELELLGDIFNKSIKNLVTIDNERKRLEKSKLEFISMTTHELRSPLSVMKLQLELLQMGTMGKLNKKMKESVEMVLNNTNRINNLVNDFMEVSKLETAKLKFSFIKTDLTKYIKTLVKES